MEDYCPTGIGLIKLLKNVICHQELTFTNTNHTNLTNNYLSRMRELENCLIRFKMFKNTDWTGWTDDGLMSLHPILRHLRNIENCR